MKSKLKQFFVLGFFLVFGNAQAMEWIVGLSNALRDGLNDGKLCSALLATEDDLDAKIPSLVEWGATYGQPQFFKNLIAFVPEHDVPTLIAAKLKAAFSLLLCFKKFQNGDGVGITIPKDIQLMLCDYCTPGIADIDALVDKKIEALRRWFTIKDGTSISDYYYGPKWWATTETGDDGWQEDGYKEYFSGKRYNIIKGLTDLENLDQHRPTIRENIIKALHEVPLKPIKKAKHEN